MKSARIATILGLLGPGFALCLYLMVHEPRSHAPTGTWLRMVSGPSLRTVTNTAGGQTQAIFFTVSNAGPAALEFQVYRFQWKAKHTDARGAYDDGGGLTFLASGSTTVLIPKSVDELPPMSEILAGWDIGWWEVQTATGALLDQVEDYFPVLVRRRERASGKLSEWHMERPEYRPEENRKYRDLVHGATSTASSAEPGGAANGGQPFRSETNSTSSAAGSRR